MYASALYEMNTETSQLRGKTDRQTDSLCEHKFPCLSALVSSYSPFYSFYPFDMDTG